MRWSSAVTAHQAGDCYSTLCVYCQIEAEQDEADAAATACDGDVEDDSDSEVTGPGAHARTSGSDGSRPF